MRKKNFGFIFKNLATLWQIEEPDVVMVISGGMRSSCEETWVKNSTVVTHFYTSRLFGT